MTITVRFSNFWANADSAINFFFLPLIERIYENEILLVVDPTQFVDLEVFSVMKAPDSPYRKLIRKVNQRGLSRVETFKINKPRNAAKTIWFTGENERPPIAQDHDIYLSFDSDSFFPKNLYLPLWVLNINWFNLPPAHGFISFYSKESDLMKPREVNLDEVNSRKFCCAFINNPEPVRLGILRELNKVKQVDLFGSLNAQIKPDKLVVAREYKFILCFENTLYPGYVTEKIVEGYQSTALPLYWGIDEFGYFHEDSNLNFRNYTGSADYIKSILDLDQDSKQLVTKLNSPLIKRSFEMDEFIQKMRRILI
jgi:hypothetical protein